MNTYSPTAKPQPFNYLKVPLLKMWTHFVHTLQEWLEIENSNSALITWQSLMI